MNFKRSAKLPCAAFSKLAGPTLSRFGLKPDCAGVGLSQRIKKSGLDDRVPSLISLVPVPRDPEALGRRR